MNDLRVIFLDIDGVLNSFAFFSNSVDANPADSRGCGAIDREAVKNLNLITEETGAKIVLSSSWRLNKTIEQMNALLKSMGMASEIIDFTPEQSQELEVSGKSAFESPQLRWTLIKEWLGKNECESFVILDDIPYMGELNDYLIAVDSICGLSHEDALTAIYILEGRER